MAGVFLCVTVVVVAEIRQKRLAAVMRGEYGQWAEEVDGVVVEASTYAGAWWRRHRTAAFSRV
jgi:hypothetical protein